MTVAALDGSSPNARRRRLALAVVCAAAIQTALLLALTLREPDKRWVWHESGPVFAVALLPKARMRPIPPPKPAKQSNQPASGGAPAVVPQTQAALANASAKAPNPVTAAGVDPRVQAALRGLAGCRLHGVKPSAEDEAACARHFGRLADAAPKLPVTNDPRKAKELKAWGDYELAMDAYRTDPMLLGSGMGMPDAPEPEQRANTCRFDKNSPKHLGLKVKCKFW